MNKTNLARFSFLSYFLHLLAYYKETPFPFFAQSACFFSHLFQQFSCKPKIFKNANQVARNQNPLYIKRYARSLPSYLGCSD